MAFPSHEVMLQGKMAAVECLPWPSMAERWQLRLRGYNAFDCIINLTQVVLFSRSSHDVQYV